MLGSDTPQRRCCNKKLFRGFWGVLGNDGSVSENNYLYNGIEKTSDFGLNWDMAVFRSYDAAIGRWMQVDPIAESMANWSPYNFGFNNPISFIDPLGLSPTDPPSILPEVTVTATSTAPKKRKRTVQVQSMQENLPSGYNEYLTEDSARISNFEKIGLDYKNGQVRLPFGWLGESAGIFFRNDHRTVVIDGVDYAINRNGYVNPQKTRADLPMILDLPISPAGKVNSASTLASFGGKYTFGQLRKALNAAYKRLGVNTLPKGKKGKFGSPQRGDSKKGVRLDSEGHPKTTNPNETGAHINWWDFSKGKRGKGGKSGATKID